MLARRFCFWLGAALVCLPASGAATQGPGDEASVVPPRAVLYLEVSGEPCSRAGGELALARIAREPEVREFLKPLLSMAAPAWMMARGQVQAQLGVGPELWDLLARGRFAAAWLGVVRQEWQEGDAPVTMWYPDFAVACEYEEDPDALADAVDAVEALITSEGMGTGGQEDWDGTMVRRFTPARGRDLFYVVAGPRLLLANRRETLREILALQRGAGAGSLADQPSFRAARERVRRPDSVLFAYADVQALMRFGAEMAGDEQSLALLDLFPYRFVGYGVDLDGPGVWDRAYAELPADSWARAMIPAEPKPLRSLGLAPADAGLYWGQRIELLPGFEAVMRIVSAMMPEVVAPDLAALSSWEQRIGVRVREDLLAHLGPEMAFYLSFPGSSIVPDACLLVEVQDTARVEEVLERILRAALPGVPVRQVRSGDAVVRYLDFSRARAWRQRLGGIAPRPAWAFAEGFLVVALWPQSIRNLLAGLRDGAPRLPRRPDFAALAARPDGAPDLDLYSLTYMDLQGAAAFVLDNGVPFLQSAVPSLPQLPLEVAAFPRAEVITRHLFGLYARGKYGPDGAYSETYSPAGLLPSYAVLVGAMVGVVLAQAEGVQIHLGPTPSGPGGAEDEEF